MGSNLRRPVTCQEVITAVTKSGIPSDVAWTLRLLAYQHFRPENEMGAWADQELSMLYADDFNEEPTEATAFDDLEPEEFLIGPHGKIEDTTPPDFPFSRPIPHDCKISRQPLSLPCRDRSSDAVRSDGTPIALRCVDSV